MCVLLDECLPRKLKTDLQVHDTRTVPEMGWAGKTNGELLHLAAQQFDVFLTIDRSLDFQQNLSLIRIIIITLVARTNRLEDLRPLMPKVLEALPEARPGEVIKVEA